MLIKRLSVVHLTFNIFFFNYDLLLLDIQFVVILDMKSNKDEALAVADEGARIIQVRWKNKDDMNPNIPITFIYINIRSPHQIDRIWNF